MGRDARRNADDPSRRCPRRTLHDPDSKELRVQKYLGPVQLRHSFQAERTIVREAEEPSQHLLGEENQRQASKGNGGQAEPRIRIGVEDYPTRNL